VPLEKLLQMVAQGIVHPDLVSTLAARLARLGQEMEATHHAQIAEAAGGRKLSDLVSGLLSSVEPDKTAARAAEKYGLAPGADPSEKQLDAVEREYMVEALQPFHAPKLRETILGIKASLEQVIDEVTRDALLSAHYDTTSVEKAKSLVSDFKQFVRDNKDEIEAIKLLYSKPYRAGLRYRHVRDLAMKLNRPPFAVKPDDPDSVRVLWSAHAAAEPDSIKTGGGNALVDLVALVRHAIHPKEPVVAVRSEVEENYRAWLADKEKAGIGFTAEQRQWLDAIKDHIAQSLAIEQTDFDDVPFNRMGGLGKVYQLFGDRLPALLNELNDRLAA
jgi:type I restriction enzyme R subunit